MYTTITPDFSGLSAGPLVAADLIVNFTTDSDDSSNDRVYIWTQATYAIDGQAAAATTHDEPASATFVDTTTSTAGVFDFSKNQAGTLDVWLADSDGSKATSKFTITIVLPLVPIWSGVPTSMPLDGSVRPIVNASFGPTDLNGDAWATDAEIDVLVRVGDNYLGPIATPAKSALPYTLTTDEVESIAGLGDGLGIGDTLALELMGPDGADSKLSPTITITAGGSVTLSAGTALAVPQSVSLSTGNALAAM